MTQIPTESSLATQWFHLELAFGPAVLRQQRNDPDANIDWTKTDHYVRIGALSVACALLEDAGLKKKNEHIRMLFEIRNALIHNGGDMALNRNSSALISAQNYLNQDRHKDISQNLDSPYFSLTDTVVVLQSNIYFALRLCMR
jgi:hypothetical protein